MYSSEFFVSPAITEPMGVSRASRSMPSVAAQPCKSHIVNTAVKADKISAIFFIAFVYIEVFSDF